LSGTTAASELAAINALNALVGSYGRPEVFSSTPCLRATRLERAGRAEGQAGATRRDLSPCSTARIQPGVGGRSHLRREPALRAAGGRSAESRVRAGPFISFRRSWTKPRRWRT
jgi:hypothetical protein